MANTLEALMIFCFGLSWPISIRKSLVSRTAKGKSLFFEVLIWVGYIFGVARKFLLWQTPGAALGFMFYLSWGFYVLNFLEITVDIGLYFRNARLDRLRDAEAEAGTAG